MPVTAPSCSRMALVAMVVPWNTTSMVSRGMPYLSQSAIRPETTPREGSSGVVDTLWTAVWPASVSAKTRSVKVPPTSTPIIRIRFLPLDPATHVPLPRQPPPGGEEHERCIHLPSFAGEARRLKQQEMRHG